MVLEQTNGLVHTAHVASNRPFFANTLLHHKSPQDAVDMIASIYSICGHAQANASIKAMEQALNIEPSFAKVAARAQMVNMETLREHVWRILLDWPLMIGKQANKKTMTAMLITVAEWKKVTDPQNLAFHLESEVGETNTHIALGVLDSCEGLLQSSVYAMAPKQWLNIETMDDLFSWAKRGQTDAAQLISMLQSKGWLDLGQTDVKHLPTITKASIQTLLTSEQPEQFMQRPELDGETFETTPLSRQLNHPLIQALQSRYGNGILTRLVAVLIEVADNYCVMRKQIVDGAQVVQTDENEGLDAVSDMQEGVGIVEAARGRLIHRVGIENGLVSLYQIVAPTEWNFHPRGALALGLKGLKGDDSSLKEQAQLLVHGLDPCVKFTLQVVNHA